VSGERRIKAAQRLGWTEIEATEIGALDPLQREVLQLEENIRRKPLRWIEEVAAERRIHEIQQKLFGPGQPGTGEGWSIRDTARMLRQSVGKISQDIRLAEGVEKWPALRKEESKVQAQRKLEKLISKSLEDPSAGTLLEYYRECFVCYDPEEYMKGQLEDHSVDLLITDIASLSSSQVTKLLELMRLKMTPAAQGIIFYAGDQYVLLRSLFTRFNIISEPEPRIWWVRRTDSYLPFFWFSFMRKAPPVHFKKVYNYPYDPGSEEREKPKNLLTNIIFLLSPKSGKVFDPYAFSGKIIDAAVSCHRQVIAVCPSQERYREVVKELERMYERDEL